MNRPEAESGAARRGYRVVLLVTTLSLIIATAIVLMLEQQPSASTPVSAPAMNSSGLSGTRSHDFGIVQIESIGGQVQHTFVLTNTTDRNVRIQGISTTCGCTDAAANPELIPPNCEVHVTATLHLSDSGPKTAQVHLITDSDHPSPVVLTMRAVGRRLRKLTATSHHLRVPANESAVINVYLIDYEHDHAPPSPLMQAPRGFSAEAGDWRLVEARRPDRDLPARWAAEVAVVSTPEASGSIHRLQISVPDVQPLTVTLQQESNGL